MSLWYFLSDWFGGIPTLGTWFKRSMINFAWAFAIISAMAVFDVPFEYAAVVFFSMFIGNFVTLFVYQQQQRDRTRD